MRMFKALAVIVYLVVPACSDTGTTPTPDPQSPVADVTVTLPRSSVPAGQTITAVPTLRNSAGVVLTGRQITWASSDAGIATVTSAGVVTGIAPGMVTVTASSEGKSGSAALEVTRAPARSVALSVGDSTLELSESRTVTAVVTDATGTVVTDRSVAWSVEDSSGATVSEGVVRASHPGPLTVTATVEGVSATIELGAYRRGFVTRLGRNFMLDGRRYSFGGSNSYWALYDPNRSYRATVASNVKHMEGRVLRVWGNFERGSADGTIRSVAGTLGAGTTLQSWDPGARRPIINTGANGLVRLDEMVAEASRQGLRVAVSLTDNWHYNGGIDQYVVWYGGQYHDDFYTDERIKQAYRDYVRAVLTRVNTITGVRYADDPTIFAWELANEMSCHGHPEGGLRGRDTCSHDNTLGPWITEMSAFVKSIDRNHLVGIGELGSMDRTLDPQLGERFSWSHWPDYEATIRFPHIDYGSYHFYLEGTAGSSLSDLEWTKLAIKQFEAVSIAANKPSIMGEFNDPNEATRAATLDALLQTLYDAEGVGFLHYQIGAPKFCGQACADRYEVAPGSAAFATLATWSARFNARGSDEGAAVR